MIKMYTVPFVVVLVHVHINCTCWLSSIQFKNLSTLFWYSKQVHFRLFLVILTTAPYTHLGDINITGCRKKSNFAGFSETNLWKKWLNSQEIWGVWGKFCWKMIGRKQPGHLLLENNRFSTDMLNVFNLNRLQFAYFCQKTMTVSLQANNIRNTN